jgi:CsoR family transcriptional regulator, copper-sensing transcriptional repressor
MIDADTRRKALGRLRRIEGQVQGIQRMLRDDKPCADVLLQLAAVEGAVAQVQRVLLGRQLEVGVADAVRSGNGRDRQRKVGEVLAMIARFSRR